MKYYKTNIDVIKTDSLLNFSALAFLLIKNNVHSMGVSAKK